MWNSYIYGFIPLPLFALLVIAALFLLTVFSLGLFDILLRRLHGRQCPKQTAHAVVEKKSTCDPGDTNGVLMHFVTFLLDSQERVELHLREEQFDALEVGDEGMLTRQGRELIGFEPK